MKPGVSKVAAMPLVLASGVSAAQQKPISTDPSGNFFIDARASARPVREVTGSALSRSTAAARRAATR